MSFNDCLQQAVRAKEITKDEADILGARFEGYRQANGAGPTADAEAKRLLAEELRNRAVRKKRLALLAARNLAQVDADLAAYRTPQGGSDMGAAAIRKLEHFGDAPFSSVAGVQKALLGIAHARMEGMLHNFRRSALLGDNLNIGNLRLSFRKNQAGLANVVKEAFGENSGDAAARHFYRSFDDTAEWLRQRFNALGGEIRKLDNWMPQSHNRLALLRAGKDEWKKAIRPALDWENMLHPQSGARILDAEIDGILNDVYDAIVTQGWSKREPTRAQMGRGALANQHAEARFLHFRDAESWSRYQADFGEGDTFTAMMGHINAMTRDIAALEVLGPNPNGTIEYMRQRITKAASGLEPMRQNKARNQIHQMDNVWAGLRGELETPVHSGWAETLGGARNFIVSSVLGGAWLSSISDIGFQNLARRFNGLPVAKTIPSIVNQFREAPRRDAVRAGLVLEAAAHTFQRQARYVGSLGGPQWTQWLADRTLTLGLLSPWTQAGRHAFGMDAMGAMAEHSGRALRDLPTPLQNMLRRWGFSDADWDKMRSGPLYEPERGATFLRPSDIGDERLAQKYLEMILQETEYAVPNFSHRGKAALGGGTKPGTIVGEMIRSGLMFKSFGTTVALLQSTRIGQAAAQGGHWSHGAGYASMMLITATLWGALAMQLKQVVAGRDPRDMTTSKFWGAAMMQGGGLGIFGDYLFSDLNRYGGGLSTTIAGPLINSVGDFLNLTAGNALKLANGESTNIGRDAIRFGKGHLPVAGTMWYLRLAGERVFWDNLQRLVDPDADAAFRRSVQNWERNTGQGFFWAPGTNAPQRAPDVAAVAGGGLGR